MISKYTPLCQTASINNINKEVATPPPPKKLRNQFKHISNSKVMPMIIDISSLIFFLTPSKSGNTNWKNFSFSDFDPTSKVFLLKVGKKFATRYPNRNGRSLGWTLPRLFQPAFVRCFDRRPLAVQCPRVVIPNLAPGDWWIDLGLCLLYQASNFKLQGVYFGRSKNLWFNVMIYREFKFSGKKWPVAHQPIICESKIA